MVHLEFGQNRLAPPHPLNTLKLAQRTIEDAFEVRLIAEQAIESGGIRYVATVCLQHF